MLAVAAAAAVVVMQEICQLVERTSVGVADGGCGGGDKFGRRRVALN